MAKTTKSDPTTATLPELPAEVVDAIARLRATSPAPDELTAAALTTVLDYLSPQDAA